MFCPSRRFAPTDVWSSGRFVPMDVCPTDSFVPIDVCPTDNMFPDVFRTFCLGTPVYTSNDRHILTGDNSA